MHTRLGEVGKKMAIETYSTYGKYVILTNRFDRCKCCNVETILFSGRLFITFQNSPCLQISAELDTKGLFPVIEKLTCKLAASTCILTKNFGALGLKIFSASLRDDSCDRKRAISRGG